MFSAFVKKKVRDRVSRKNMKSTKSILNFPNLFLRVILCLFKNFQLHFVGSYLEAIYDKKIAIRLLPVEYLPDDYTGPNNGHLKDLISKTLHINGPVTPAMY